MESPILTYMRSVHAELAQLHEGEPYIVNPASSTVNPRDFGIALATVDGQIYEVGTTRKRFSIQSISKPLSYGIALADLGTEIVDQHVDVEPSGDPFNELSVSPETGRPANAMINAGALAVSSLIKGSGGRSAIQRIESAYSDFAGRPLRSNGKEYRAERARSDRNHGLAYLLSSANVIEGDPTKALETYLRQCTVQVTCSDLAVMAATLASGGTNPVTGVEVLPYDAVERVLSVMMMSGMYDDAGDWAASVGMPAKSGVGGGIMAVLPGQVGLAVYSPPLDQHGNSVRGAAACHRISADLQMHFVRSARAGRSAIRSVHSIDREPSNIRRTAEAVKVLQEHSKRALVFTLTGDLFFAGTETVVRELSSISDDTELIIVDMSDVDEVGEAGLRLINKTFTELVASGREVLLIDPEEHFGGAEPSTATTTTPTEQPTSTALSTTTEPAEPPTTSPTASSRTPTLPRHISLFDSVDRAIAWCEQWLLERYGTPKSIPRIVPVLDAPVLAPLDPADIAKLVSRMEPRNCKTGEVIRRVGQRFGGVFFILSGTISIVASHADGTRFRLRTLGAGMSFGELTLGNSDREETTAKAEGPVKLMVLDAEAVEALEAEDPALALQLWRALARDAHMRVDRLSRISAARIRE